MKVLRKDKLIKLQFKNRGNSRLIETIDTLISDLEKAEWKNKTDIIHDRPDADCVHSDGFYFFNINIHRTMALIAFQENEAIIVWAGSHDEYDAIFKGNKKTIERWLRFQQLI